MNGMTQPKSLSGPNSPGHQPDDNMAFMNYYHLIRYESDPKLLSMFLYAIHNHWQYEQLERNAFTNFIYGACCLGRKRRDQWGENNLSPPLQCFEDAVDTLKRYPFDLIEWPMSNAHRTDLVPIGNQSEQHAQIGCRCSTNAARPSVGKGMRLRPGFHYLLAYYLGRYHGFVAE